MTPLHTYHNGDYTVTLFSDGTKVREGAGRAALPESIDVKITDFCNMGCRYCHEQSTVAGVACDMDDLQARLRGLPRGVELAIGGGNPLSHPQLAEFLSTTTLIPNLTLHQGHLSMYHDLDARGVLDRVYGIGVSVTDISRMRDVTEASIPHLVWHVIAGITPIEQLLRIPSDARPRRLLVLGYKQFGFGTAFFQQQEPIITRRLNAWRWWITRLMIAYPSVSFDNLAIRQLGIQERLTPEAYAEHYMGDDGAFTMYYDAVTREYAMSSTSHRHPIGDMTLVDAFQHVQEMRQTR